MIDGLDDYGKCRLEEAIAEGLSESDLALCVKVAKMSVRKDSLHPVVSTEPLEHHVVSFGPLSKESRQGEVAAPAVTTPILLPLWGCQVDNLTFKYSQFGSFIPGIMNRLEMALLADDLARTTLHKTYLPNYLLLHALTATSAQGGVDYQRLEFLGDSILKFSVSLQLMGEYPDWTEGQLSIRKDQIVANTRLAAAALETGLDRHIITKAFTGQRWQVPLVEYLISPTAVRQRNISRKVLADVVEAVVAVAFLSGMFENAMNCLSVFLPEITWKKPRKRVEVLKLRALFQENVLKNYGDLEAMIGHRFACKPLIREAMAHAAGPIFEDGEPRLLYQRLEFLGDSILDVLVVGTLFNYEHLHHSDMHLIRAALVNEHFLGFLSLGLKKILVSSEPLSYDEGRSEAAPSVDGLTKDGKASYFWHFMNHQSKVISDLQVSAFRRYV
jgi:dsRNA-specific ribonuclease